MNQYATAPEVEETADALIASVVKDRFNHHLQNRNYVIMLTSGVDDGGKRATLAFSAACSARAMDLKTQVFLIGDGSHWAYEGSADGVRQQGFPALEDLLDSYMELGGQIFVCSACDSVCTLPMDEHDRPLRKRPGVEPRGLASILSYTVEGTSVTF